jgi:hypothetical protein
MSSFLKKLGKGILTGAGYVAGFAPMIKQYTPDNVDRKIDLVVDTSTKISDIVKVSEVMGQALQVPGPDKLKAAAPLVAQILLQSDAFKSHKIKDPVLFQQAAVKIADGFADAWNSVDPADLPGDN